MEGWVNVDASPGVRADVQLDAIDFIRRHGPEVEELYMGHFLEHLMPRDSHALLRLIAARVPSGALISAVCPDIQAIMKAYLAGEIGNQILNESFIYSYVQPSHHVWCYDTASLTGLFESVGLVEVHVIDPLTWPPVFHKEGPESAFQCGVAGRVGSIPASLEPEDDSDASDPVTTAAEAEMDGIVQRLPMSTEEVLLQRVQRYRDRIHRLKAEARELRRKCKEGDHLFMRLKDLEARYADLDVRSREREARYELLAGSRTVAVAGRAQRLAGLILPAGSSRRRLIGRLLRLVRSRQSGQPRVR